MVCRKCKYTIIDEAEFCPNCGQKLNEQSEQSVKCCPSCGEVINEGNKFCTKCGTSVCSEIPINSKPNSDTDNLSGVKIKRSYFASVISAIISFIIRIATQETFYSWDNLLDNRKVVGIDSDTKPFLSVIPIVAAIIVSLLIVSDKETSSQKKATAFIVNAIFITLAILFIWFDIPYQIFDF